MVYKHTEAKFKAFVAFLKSSYLLDAWSKEYLDDQWIATEIQPWFNMYFDQADDIGDRLKNDLVKLIRHVAQTRSVPEYLPFTDRDLYDLDQMAHRWQDLPFLALRQHLTQEFGKPGMLWKTFYKTFDRFETATHAAMRRILDEPVYGNTSPEAFPSRSVEPDRDELSEEEKEQVKQRDNYTCLACDVKGMKLEIDHIIPRKFGGETSIENSQALCTICNGPRGKGINEINFRSNVTQLSRPKLLNLSLPHKQQTVTRVITRIVNFFYHCRAFYKLTMHTRSNGRYYSTWKIELYAGNDPAWLLQHKAALLKFIQTELEHDHVQDLEIVTPSRAND